MKIDRLNFRRDLLKQRPFVAIIMVQLIVLFMIMAYYTTARADSSAMAAATRASSMPFHLYDDVDGRANGTRVPELPEELTGVVIAVWSADTVQNRRACLSRWLFKRATETLCASLARQKIVSVRTDTVGLNLVAYVAVSLSVQVAVNDRVRMRRARQDADGTIETMPVITALFSSATAGGGSFLSR